MEPLKQFRYDLSKVAAQGLPVDVALVFLQMQQREQHHKEMMKKLDDLEDWVRAIRQNKGPFYS